MSKIENFNTQIQNQVELSTVGDLLPLRKKWQKIWWPIGIDKKNRIDRSNDW